MGKFVLFLVVVVLLNVLLSTLATNNIEGKDAADKVQKAIQAATKAYDEKVRLLTLNGAQSAKYHSRGPSKSSKETQEIGRISTIYRNAFVELTSKSSMDRKSTLKLLRDALPSPCESRNITCDPKYKYRSIDGTCNNEKNPLWGSAVLPFKRLLPAAYEDNDAPRGGLEDSTLPSPREITMKVHSGTGGNFETSVTHMVAQFGQFLDHDLDLTPVDDSTCCDDSLEKAEDCWKIEVPLNDTHYHGKLTCLNFVRSTPACFPSSSPEIEHREQFNNITAFIDGSNVYGSNEEISTLLRSKEGGKLVENSEHDGFLPWRSEVITNGTKSVIAGDIRANEMPGLTVMHVLFLREHNRIATKLAELEKDWDDERLFQETRRIVGAELQQITYSEFLPAILGEEAMKTYELQLPSDTKSYTVYDPKMDATISNSFATAAYRFGHTLVNGLIQLYMGGNIVGDYNVRDNYLVSDRVLETHNGTSGYDLILNGLIRQKSQKFDGEIHEDMTNYLFMDKSNQIGEDLAARNIQRGRDHGLPSYNKFREFCKISPLTSWDNRPGDFSEESWNKLRDVYTSPEDIDLYTGGLSQTAEPNALAGRTFICLMAEQFRRLKYGDRFFFTHKDNIGSFTTKQLAELRKRTLGSIICENSAINETTKNVFYIQSESNPMLPCNESRALDISLFTSSSDTPDKGSGSRLAALSIYSVSIGIFVLVVNISFKLF